jgi:uncharacterized membrane protein
MKILTKKEILPIILIIFAFLVGLSLYPKLPDQVPSHWNTQGEVDAWSGKTFAVFFFPTITLVIYLLITLIPLIDPFRKNYLKFAKAYFWFRMLFVAFFVSLYFYTLWSAFGMKLSINYFIIPLLSLFFILIGLFLPKVKRNYFVGIRTPWTIHSEETWDKTHKFAGRSFVVAGLISFLGIFIPDYSFIIFIIAILSAALIPVIYSYFVFKRIGGFK